MPQTKPRPAKSCNRIGAKQRLARRRREARAEKRHSAGEKRHMTTHHRENRRFPLGNSSGRRAATKP
ncbi:hypothetical protein CSE45_4124 [Citreicella sp. SE45]|nr:hypothetical protein CSE45_4124 [Citreicella sp. SE45]